MADTNDGTRKWQVHTSVHSTNNACVYMQSKAQLLVQWALLNWAPKHGVFQITKYMTKCRHSKKANFHIQLEMIEVSVG